MSFFVTSVGVGNGGNLGGLAGADAHCQKLATAAGRGSGTWHAYLSTQGPNAVNARDRIGKGPWYNGKGELVARDVNDLHRDAKAWEHVVNEKHKLLAMNEKKELIPGEGETPNRHEVMTGATPDGRAFTDGMDHTCNSWTSNTTGKMRLGHSDFMDRESEGQHTSSWNSAHDGRADCSQKGLEGTGMGVGYFYCFAVN